MRALSAAYELPGIALSGSAWREIASKARPRFLARLDQTDRYFSSAEDHRGNAGEWRNRGGCHPCETRLSQTGAPGIDAAEILRFDWLGRGKFCLRSRAEGAMKRIARDDLAGSAGGE